MAPIPKYMVVTAWLAGGLGAVQAVVWALLCSIVLITFDSCNEGAVVTGNGYFFHILNTHYLKECSENSLFDGGILNAAWVRIWVIISLSFSLLWLLLSAGLVIAADTSDEVPRKVYQPLAITWSVATFAASAIDIATGTLFAIDFARLNDALSGFVGGATEAYALDTLRLGAFLLMTLCLKGYVLLLANLAFTVVMAVFSVQAGKIVATSEHSVHTRGVLRAFSNANKQEDPWKQHQNYDSMMFERGSHVNRAFTNTNNRSWQAPQTPVPTPLSADMSRGFDRSDSWHPVKQVSEYVGSRPFSYLEEPRPRGSPTPSPHPGAAAPWRRADAWDQPPHVPDPDYSPKQIRKLKSALKPNY